jgi:uncharacterized repeat protein (TIGR01451 family)
VIRWRRGFAGALGCLLVLLLPPVAHAERDYSVRYTVNAQGDITGTGNALVTCLDSDSRCANARNAQASGADNNNNNLPVRWVDVDADPSTFNSSAATLRLPAGARVLFAGLYYGGRLQAGDGGDAAPDAAARDRVLLEAPGAGHYVELDASVIDDAGEGGRLYQGFVDVTDIVEAVGAGEYTVANVQAGTGLHADQSAGWALAVAYEDSNQPTRNLTIFDGFRFVLSDGPDVTIPLSGFITPRSGPVSSRVGLVALEGDFGTTGDSATLNERVLSNATNPSNNFFNSSISDRTGTLFDLRRPEFRNGFGFDADIFDASGFLGNNQTTTTLVLSTSGDGFAANGVSFATDLYAPSLRMVKEVDKDVATLGDELVYTVSVENTGLDAAVETHVRDTIPEGTNYVPGSLQVLAGAGAGVKTDAAGDDQAEYEAEGRVVHFRVGVGADAEHGGRLAVGASTTIRFRVRIDDEGIPTGDRIVNSARGSFLSDTLNQAGAVDSPDVSTRVLVPDLAIDKVVTDAPLEPGERTPFRLNVENVGDGPTRGTVTVTDELPDELRFAGPATGEGWQCATSGQELRCTRDDVLAAGTAWPSIEFLVRVRQNTRPSEIVNTGVVSGGGDGNELNNEDTETGATLPGRVDLAIDKQTLTRRAFPGERVSFRLRVTNLRRVTATRVRVRDLFPAGLTPLSLEPSKGRCGRSTCRLGRLRFREVVTIDVTAVAGLRTGGRVLRNVARVRSRQEDVNPDNNEDSSRVRIDKLIDLVVGKSAAAPSVPAGSDVSFVVTVRNDGPSTATGVTVADLVPGELAFVSATPTQGSCAAAVCQLGRLRRGAAAQIVVVARSDVSLAGRTLENLAVAIAREPERDLANNVGRAPVTFTAAPVQPADVEVTKTASAQQVTVGDVLTYRMSVVNRGPGPAEDVLVTETPDAAVDVISADPSQGTCMLGTPVTCHLGRLEAGDTATIVVRVRALEAGTLRNAVTVIAPTTTPEPEGQTDVAGVTAKRPPRVTLHKRPDRRVVPPGATVAYTLTVRARGSGVARNVRVCDRLPARLSIVSRGGARVRGRLACWRIRRLRAGGSRELRLRTRVNASQGMRVTNVAAVTWGFEHRFARARVRVVQRAPGVTG